MQLINTLRSLLIVTVAALVMAGCASTSTRESTGEYFDDTTITTKVKAALLKDEEVSGLRINVETFKGVVQLSGFAKSQAEKRKAHDIAHTVGGVKSVRNDIIVR